MPRDRKPRSEHPSRSSGRAAGVPALSTAPVPGAEPVPGWLTTVIASACALVIVLRLVAAGTSSNWVWGLAILRYWPRGQSAALVALALLGFLPPVARLIVRGLARWE